MIPSEIVESVDVGAPVGPGEAEETVFLAEEEMAHRPKPSTAAATAGEADANTPIPPMDELIQRIPLATRELIDQLFRAKFITVKRLPAAVFKTQN